MKRILDFDEETFFEENPDLYDLLLIDRTTTKQYLNLKMLLMTKRIKYLS